MKVMEKTDNPLKVFFFGDSICFGQGVSIHKGWVPRISEALSQLQLDHGREVLLVNASVNGNTTRLALERMPYDIQSNRPDILIVQFGMNDCNHWETDRGVPRVSAEAFVANLKEIILRAINFGAQQIILLTNHPSGRDTDKMQHTDLTYQQSNQNYNRLIREVAQCDERVVLTDMEQVFQDRIRADDLTAKDFLLADRIHLNEAGHNLYFESVIPQLKSSVMRILG